MVPVWVPDIHAIRPIRLDNVSVHRSGVREEYIALHLYTSTHPPRTL